MNIRRLYKLDSIFITLIFSAVVFIPFIIGITEDDKKISTVEKRELSRLPGPIKSAADIIAFPKLFDAYYADHFGLREWFTRHYKSSKYAIGDSPSEDVIIGKDGWLFLGSIKKGYTKYHDPIGYYRNERHYTRKELIKTVRYIATVDSWLKKRGIRYLFVIAPNKHTIYPEKLPDYITRVNGASAADQLVDYLKNKTDVHVVDLRKKLIEGKAKHQLYYKTGTHWNFMGGNIAQYEIMKAIETMFPDKITPELYKDSVFKFNVATDRALEDIAGINIEPPTYAPYPAFGPNASTIDENTIIVHNKITLRQTHTSINKNEKLNALIFRDSFFRVLEPYFIRKFRRATYIWQRLNYQALKVFLDREKPDIIIEEWVERILPYTPGTADQSTGPPHEQ